MNLWIAQTSDWVPSEKPAKLRPHRRLPQATKQKSSTLVRIKGMELNANEERCSGKEQREQVEQGKGEIAAGRENVAEWWNQGRGEQGE